MNCRIMKRDEFVERLLADQELRRRKERMRQVKAADDLGAIKRKKQERWLREAKRRRPR